jgi:hypothetical protein
MEYKMNLKRILLVGFEIIVVFAVVWLLVQRPVITSENLIVQFFEWFDLTSVRFWEDITLFVFSFGTSLVFWKRQAWGKQDKAKRLYCLFSGIFSLISLLIILAAVRFNVQIIFFGFFYFLITSLLISITLHLLTLQIKHLLLECIKIIFLGALVFEINLFSNNLVSRSHHSGETWESILLFTLIFGAIASITSLIINFSILIKQLRRKA